ncbi:hypothetical protein NEDG_02239 [Nematocida displodere]|uniref:Uncharacterized protein n=1 Tax=Nematocida displodere TaxID=1805483 RepID=A0A177ELE5_9MICR|nr:hypothetical protein NEDG_02239 [Nematocida displodere]
MRHKLYYLAGAAVVTAILLTEVVYFVIYNCSKKEEEKIIAMNGEDLPELTRTLTSPSTTIKAPNRDGSGVGSGADGTGASSGANAMGAAEDEPPSPEPLPPITSSQTNKHLSELARADPVGKSVVVDTTQNTVTSPEHNPQMPQTEATIALFKRHGCGLGTVGGVRVAKQQPSVVRIYLEKLTEEEIPDQIEPYTMFFRLYVHGSSSKDRAKPSPPGELEVLARLLQALKHVYIESFYIKRFNILQRDGLAKPGLIDLPISMSLKIDTISSLFLEWLCVVIVLEDCGVSIALEISNCGAASIACLNNLGIEFLSGLLLENFPNLDQLEYQLVDNIHSMGKLKLCNLPKLLSVSTAIAESLTKKVWCAVRMDMRVWNIICSAAKRTMKIEEMLWFRVTDAKELENNVVGVRVRTLNIQKSYQDGEQTPGKTFFGSLMKWLAANDSEEIQCVRILSEGDPMTNSPQTQRDLLALANLGGWPTIFSQTSLWVDSICVFKPEQQ